MPKLKLYRVFLRGIRPDSILTFDCSKEKAIERVIKVYGHHWSIKAENVRMTKGKMFEEIGRW